MIRVFRLPEVSKAYTFRRGTTTSTIHSLAFSPPSVKPSLLCAASAHGTVHLFLLEESVGWVACSDLASLQMHKLRAPANATWLWHYLPKQHRERASSAALSPW